MIVDMIDDLVQPLFQIFGVESQDEKVTYRHCWLAQEPDCSSVDRATVFVGFVGREPRV